MSLLAHHIIQDITPVGGWFYVQSHKDEKIRIPFSGVAGSGDELVEQVRRFRIYEGIPVGDPAFDVAEDLRVRSPHNDKFRTMPMYHTVRGEILETLRDRVRSWLDGTLPKRPVLLYVMDADARAEVCLKCPFNTPWKSGDEEQDTQVAYRSLSLRAMVTYQHDEVLMGCELHGMELSSAVFLDQDFLPKKDPQAPENCWIPAP